MEAHLYAAASYLHRLGNPTSPDGFAQADFIGFDNNDRLVAALNAGGFELTPRSFRVTTDNHLVQWELVKQGVGIGIMPAEVGDAEPLVARALPDMHPFTGEVWLVAHREVKTSRRVRMVFDFLAAEL